TRLSPPPAQSCPRSPHLSLPTGHAAIDRHEGRCPQSPATPPTTARSARKGARHLAADPPFCRLDSTSHVPILFLWCQDGLNETSPLHGCRPNSGTGRQLPLATPWCGVTTSGSAAMPAAMWP